MIQKFGETARDMSFSGSDKGTDDPEKPIGDRHAGALQCGQFEQSQLFAAVQVALKLTPAEVSAVPNHLQGQFRILLEHPRFASIRDLARQQQQVELTAGTNQIAAVSEQDQITAARVFLGFHPKNPTLTYCKAQRKCLHFRFSEKARFKSSNSLHAELSQLLERGNLEQLRLLLVARRSDLNCCTMALLMNRAAEKSSLAAIVLPFVTVTFNRASGESQQPHIWSRDITRVLYGLSSVCMNSENSAVRGVLLAVSAKLHRCAPLQKNQMLAALHGLKRLSSSCSAVRKLASGLAKLIGQAPRKGSEKMPSTSIGVLGCMHGALA